MNINDFRKYIDYSDYTMGKYLVDKGHAKITESDSDGYYEFDINGYKVNIRIFPDGELDEISCDCSQDYGYCYHIAAALIVLLPVYEKSISSDSSYATSSLINFFDNSAEYDAQVVNQPDGKINIEPVVHFDGNELGYSLKIGFDKLYSVKNVLNLYEAFQAEETVSYGKNLSFRHSYDLLDEHCEKLLEFSYNVCIENKNSHYTYDKKILKLSGNKITQFFEIMEDTGVYFDKEHYNIVHKDPVLNFSITETDNDKYFFKPEINNFYCFKYGKNTSVIDGNLNTVFICSKGFSDNIPMLLKIAVNQDLYISRKDMPRFYASVISRVSDYLNIKGIEIMNEFNPPELVPKLYLDCENDGKVTGRLEFNYDDKSYGMFYDKSKNPYCDRLNEAICTNLIYEYFDVIEDKRKKYPVYLEDDYRIYILLQKGIPKLREYMEILTTDKFDGKRFLRPVVRPTVGVRPSGTNMLELEITAEGYTNEELLEMLKAYRQGKKFHKLKDGSFASVESSLSEFSEITQSLNITDKTLLKEKIKVPLFRMLYLDNLSKNAEEIKIDRSKEFRQKVHKFNDTINFSESISVPSSLENIMREYQVQGFKWMKTIATYGFGGILADDMGLGKTLQAIALMVDSQENEKKHKPNLVVCPSSLSLNWESEIQKFSPGLKALTITGTTSQREEMFEKIPEADVVITSYSLITRDLTEYQDINFRFMFIDEAQYIKNKTTQMSKAVKVINADHKFALTGTPVENSLAELWSIFDFIMPDYLYSYTYFKKNFETPIVKNQDSKATQSLQKMVSPFILRRLKSEVLTELPDKTETILFTDMEEEQSRIYSANVAEVKVSLKNSDDSGADKIKILAMLTRLRQICCEPSLVYENYQGKSAKLEQCMELIESCVESGHKMLLFSQFTSMLDIISGKLEESGISYYMLTGSTKASMRLKMVKEFNSDNTSVFLISLKAGGTGLNLTGADVVIHYDPWWNLSAENQASDRAYRIGQKNNVQIYKMITRHTIEEKIREMQQSKSQLADIALGGDNENSNIMHMSKDDILKLLE